jgi:hypothetical protein
MKKRLNAVYFSMLLVLLGFTQVQAKDLTPLKFFPSNGNFLVQVDVQHIQNTQTFKDLYTFYISNPTNQKDMNEFKENFSIDPLKDIDHVTFHVTAEDKGNADFLAVIKGKFNQDKLIPAVEKAWGKLKKDKINQALVLSSEAQKEKSVALVDQFLILGSEDAVKAAINKTTPFTSALAPMLSQIPDGALDIWMAIAMNKKMQDELKQNNPMAGEFDTIISTIDMSTGFHFIIKALANNENASKSVADMMNAQLQEFLKSPNAMMFASFLSKIKIIAKGKELEINWPLDQQAVNQIKGLIGMFMAGMQQQNQAPMNANPFPAPAPTPMLPPPVVPSVPVKP